MTNPSEAELAARYLLDKLKQGDPPRTGSIELDYASEALTLDVAGTLAPDGVFHVDPDDQPALDRWVRTMAHLKQAGFEVGPVKFTPALPREMTEIRGGGYVARIRRTGGDDA